MPARLRAVVAAAPVPVATLFVATLLVAALLAVGCGSVSASHAPAAAAVRPDRPAASNTVAVPAQAAIATGAARRRAASGYLAIARPANRRLDRDFDDAVNGDDVGDLAASRADLRDAAATERRFDRQLLALPLAPGTEAIARILVAANQSRARLTEAAARATSLTRLHGFERRLDAANEPVEDAVRVIRSELGLPPPESG